MKDFDYIVPNAMSYKMLIKSYAKNEGDDTLDSIFNLVEEAYYANGVFLDSMFQWWNMFFDMFRVAWGSREKWPGKKKKYDDDTLSMIVVANIYDALIITVMIT